MFNYPHVAAAIWPCICLFYKANDLSLKSACSAAGTIAVVCYSNVIIVRLVFGGCVDVWYTSVRGLY